MPPRASGLTPKRAVFLLAVTTLVHAMAVDCAESQSVRQGGTSPKVAAPSPGSQKMPEIRYGTAGLPAPVAEMREAILAAVRSGDIDDLKVAIEMNEIKPAFSDGPVPDPIAWLKQQSGDGTGKSLLEAIGRVLEAGHVVLPYGRDAENNRIFVWPYFAETGVLHLSPQQQAELAALVPAEAVAAMAASGRYAHWRIVIAADGTWHALAR